MIILVAIQGIPRRFNTNMELITAAIANGACVEREKHNYPIQYSHGQEYPIGDVA
jgi:hypothetical protein